MDEAEAMPVHVLGLQIEPSSGTSIVLLGEPGEPRRVLPIFIGPAEAQSIAIAAQGLALPRPGTHDLLIAALHAVDTSIADVAIVGLREHTFLGELRIEMGSEVRHVDARPSDAIAVALREGAPIVVSTEVFRAASIEILRDPDEPFQDVEIEEIVDQFRDFLHTAHPDDFATPSDQDDQPGREPDTDD